MVPNRRKLIPTKRLDTIVDMSTFYYPIEISSLASNDSIEVEALVDTGAFFTTLPAQLLQELGVQPTDSQEFRLANGQTMRMDLGDAQISIDGRSVNTLVAFGPDEGLNLLGAYTLEGLRLSVDPTNARLEPLGPVTL